MLLNKLGAGWEMKACSQCGAENEEHAAYCFKCGELLPGVADQLAKSTTRVFEEKDEGPVAPKRRWGTARFDRQTTVVFHVRGYEKPLVLQLEHELVMGRSYSDAVVDVDFTAFGAIEAGVSRRHAMLRRQNETVVVIDLGSANSTFLNGQRIIPDEPRILRDGDELRLGRLVVRASFEDILP
jgi:hypothetical protein